MEIIVIAKQDLKPLLMEVLIEFEKTKSKGIGEKLYYINQVAKLLGKSFATIKKLALNGTIRTTRNGLIPESAIEEYLNKS